MCCSACAFGGRHGIHDADQGVTHDLIADLIAAPHHGSDDRVCPVTLVLHGFVQRRVEIFAFVTESRKPESLKAGRTPDPRGCVPGRDRREPAAAG